MALPTECPFCNGYYRASYSRLSALRAVPRTRVGFRSWRFCVVLKADNLVQINTPADAEANLDSSDYVFIDLRKADDYKAGHIKGAIAADMDACKGGDFQNGVDTMKAALKGPLRLVAGRDSVVDERHGGRGGLLLDCSAAWAQSARKAVPENGTCDHRAIFRAAWRPKRAHRAPAPVRLVRLRELLRRLDLDVFQGLHDCDGHRAASGGDCVLLCGRYAHWWCKDAGHSPAHSLCARGARCFGAAALPRACITRQGGADAAPVLRQPCRQRSGGSRAVGPDGGR